MEELEAKVENQQQVVDVANQMRQLRLQHQVPALGETHLVALLSSGTLLEDDANQPRGCGACRRIFTPSTARWSCWRKSSILPSQLEQLASGRCLGRGWSLCGMKASRSSSR